MIARNCLFQIYKATSVMSEELKQLCEGLVVIDGCDEVLNIVKANKRPGLDRLPIEFYQTFWDKIKRILIDMYNESFI